MSELSDNGIRFGTRSRCASGDGRGMPRVAALTYRTCNSTTTTSTTTTATSLHSDSFASFEVVSPSTQRVRPSARIRNVSDVHEQRRRWRVCGCICKVAATHTCTCTAPRPILLHRGTSFGTCGSIRKVVSQLAISRVAIDRDTTTEINHTSRLRVTNFLSSKPQLKSTRTNASRRGRGDVCNLGGVSIFHECQFFPRRIRLACERVGFARGRELNKLERRGRFSASLPSGDTDESFS